MQNYGQAALPFARKEIGVKEHPPNSNDGPRVEVLRNGKGPEPWCADFVEWCLERAGWERPTFNWSYCPSWVAARDAVADHLGLVAYVASLSAFRSIEGNTAIGNNSNGGQVMLRSRNRSDVAAFIRLPASLAHLPYGGSLRLVIPGHDLFAGWEECLGPMRNIARNGLTKQGCVIAWRGNRWEGPRDVTNVVRNLVHTFQR